MSSQRLLTPAGVLLAAVLLSFLFCTLCAWTLAESREDTYEHAVENARNVLLVLERDITRNIELYDLSLHAVVDGIQDPQIMALPHPLLERVLFDRAATGRYLGSIAVTDAVGNVTLSSEADDLRKSNVSSDDFFRFHQEGNDTRLYIGEPYRRTRDDPSFALPLSHRVSRPDDAFAGVVVGTLDVGYFRALLEGIVVGEHGTAAVIETNGALVTRIPYDEKVVGRDVSGAAVFKQAMARDEGVYVGEGTIDGIRRLYVFKHLPGLSLIVDVAPAESDIYAGWYRRAERLCILMVTTTLLILGGAGILARELKRRSYAEMKLQLLAQTDSLTGLRNRGHFDDYLDLQWRLSGRDNQALSMLFIDIDEFKAYNDHYGHQAGDEVLKAVARTTRACLPAPDEHLARYGGEEFVITLPGTSLQGAKMLAEKVREAIADMNIVHIGSIYGRVTVSVGVATSEGPKSASSGTLVAAADRALYAAKSSGRNCVVMERNSRNWVVRSKDEVLDTHV